MADDYEEVGGFVELLRSRADGSFEEELDTKLRRLVKLCDQRGGLGSISLTIKVMREKKYDDPVYLIQHDMTVKEPSILRKAGILFADNEGTLSRNKPEQGELDMTPAGRDTVVTGKFGKEGDDDLD